MAIDFSKYGEKAKSPVSKVATSDYSKYGVPTEEPSVNEPQIKQSETTAAGNFAGGALYKFSAPGRTIQNLLVSGAEKITGKDLSRMRPTKEAFEQSTGTNLDTTAAKVGGVAGEVATFAIPGGFAAKATTGANIMTRLGAQSLSDATVQSLNQGEINKNTVDAAILGAVFPAGAEGLTIVKNKLAPVASSKIINSLIKPLLKDFSYGKNPGKAVAEAGITANSLDDLVAQIKSKRQAIGNEISQKISNVKTKYSAEDAFQPIDDAIEEASRSPRTNAAIITRLQNLKDDIFGVATVDGQTISTRKLSDLTAQEILELKQEVGNLTRWTGNASDDEIVNKALKRTYSSLKQKLDESIEGVKSLNEKYADLKSAEIATEYRDKIASRQNLISLTGTQTGIGAALATSIVTGGVTTPLLVGAGATALTQALRTPAVKTRVAAWLASAGQDEVQSVIKQAPWFRSVIQSALFGEDGNDTNTQQ